MRSSRVFITGGAGFIGSHLVDRLIADRNKVTVYDNLSSGSTNNIRQHMGASDFKFIQADLLNYPALSEAMAGHEIVWHLGSNTDIIGGNENTDLDLKSCTVGTRNVLEAMRHNQIKTILYASSASVYGDVPPIALSETYGPLLPISLYGAGKLAGEGLISAFCHLFGIRGLIFRFGNVIGTRMGHGVILDFIHKLRHNPQGLEILGDGNQEKNFFLVEDCIEGMRWALEKSGSSCEVYNLGGTSSIKVVEIARIVIEEMKLKDVKFRFTGGKRGWPGDAPYARIIVDKMKGLGWNPTHNSQEAVRIAARQLIAEVEQSE